MTPKIPNPLEVCLECGCSMGKRNGKFGPFSYCPSGHGTASIQGSKIYVKGAIYAKYAAYHEAMRKSHYVEPLEMRVPDINRIVLGQMSSMGFHMSDLDLFIEGGKEAASDEDDHWRNTRAF